MPNFTRMEEDIPIITSQPIASGSEGLDAIAKTFGGISQDAIREAKAIGQEQSNAMMLQTQAHTDSIKNDAFINMRKHPDMSDLIEKNSAQEYQNTVQQAVVNDADRKKLDYLASKDQNAIKLKAAETAFQNQKIEGQIALYTKFPALMDGLKASFGDEKAFDIKFKAIQDNIASALRSHAIRIDQGAALYKVLNSSLQAHNTYLENFGNKDLTAREHNQLLPPSYSDNQDHHGLPVDEHSAYIANSGNADTTVKGIKSSLAEGKAPNPVAFANITKPEKLNEIDLYSKGAMSVNRDIQTSVPMTLLESEYTELTKKAKLNNYEEGRKDRLQNLIQSGRNGEFESLIAKDGNYQGYEAEYNQKVAVIGKTPNLSDAQKQVQLKDANNYFANQKVNLASAKHIDDQYIAPIDKRFTDVGQKSFEYQEGNPGDPNLLKSTLGYWDQNLREYYARRMQTPVQQEVARAVGNLLNTGVKDNDVNALILANQKGRNYDAIKKNQSGVAEAALNYKISGSLTDATAFASKQINGVDRVVSMIDMTKNLAYYLALSNNDPQKPGNYVYQAVSIVKNAYPISKGSSWVKSDRDFPYLQKPQMDVLTNYLIDYTKQNVLLPGASHSRLSAALDVNNLQVLGTPTGNFVVKDSFDNVLHTRKFSSNLLALAYVEHEKQMNQRKKILGEFSKDSRSLYKMLQDQNSQAQPQTTSEPDTTEFEALAMKGFKAADAAFAAKQLKDKEDEETQRWRKRGAKAAKKNNIDTLLSEDEK